MQMFTIIPIYRLTSHINIYIVTYSHKETPIFICSQIHILAFTHPKSTPRYMHSHSHTLTSKHTFTLTDSQTHSQTLCLYKVMYIHALAYKQIHIHPQVNISMSPHAHTHSQKQTKLSPHSSTNFLSLAFNLGWGSAVPLAHKQS